jgi:hypothetical protein
MNRSVLMVLILVMLLITAIAPFSGLALLMLFLLVAGIGWAVWSLLQAAIQGSDTQ